LFNQPVIQTDFTNSVQIGDSGGMMFPFVVGKAGQSFARHFIAFRAIPDTFRCTAGNETAILMQGCFAICACELLNGPAGFPGCFLNVTSFRHDVTDTGTTIYSAKRIHISSSFGFLPAQEWRF
jgi:hypothetical protein